MGKVGGLDGYLDERLVHVQEGLNGAVQEVEW